MNTTFELSLASIDKGHHKTTYRGVDCIKSPFDYVIYQMIISELQPDLIIEIGANKGGCAYYMADLLKLTGKGIVHSIDIEDRVDERVKKHDRIKFFFDGWEAYDLELAKQFEVVLIIEDSSHTYQNTLEVMRKFGPVVSKNSYFIIEDGIVDELGISAQFGGGPVKAIKEFLENSSDFALDSKWADFYGKNTTFNTIGFLKRIGE